MSRYFLIRTHTTPELMACCAILERLHRCCGMHGEMRKGKERLISQATHVRSHLGTLHPLDTTQNSILGGAYQVEADVGSGRCMAVTSKSLDPLAPYHPRHLYSVWVVVTKCVFWKNDQSNTLSAPQKDAAKSPEHLPMVRLEEE